MLILRGNEDRDHISGKPSRLGTCTQRAEVACAVQLEQLERFVQWS